MSQAFPQWVAQLQEQFGRMVRTPLERETGTLCAATRSYDQGLVGSALAGARLSSAERLAIYNRQYWFRLFTVFQGAFPLTTRLLSHFTFNAYVSRFLESHPPRDWDIDAALSGFEIFLGEALPLGTVAIDRRRVGVERLAVVQAARIDASYHRVFRATRVLPFHPGAEHSAQLLSSRLVPSPASALLEEHWPLCELRRTVASAKGEAAISLPAQLSERHFWLLLRDKLSLRLLALEPLEFQLLRLLQELAVGAALEKLERDCSARERVELPESTQRWLARSVALGVWAGLETTD
jgi:putative DNA-binding protein